ncbi:uncharacterized protein LOC144424629 [Styela clava]
MRFWRVLGLVFFLSLLSRVYTLTQSEIDYINEMGLMTITVDPQNTEILIMQSNGMPNYASIFQGQFDKQEYYYEIPRTPEDLDGGRCTPMGAIGLAINGVAIFNAFTGDCCDAGLLEDFDDCNGHPSPTNQYHYHKNPVCLHDLICGVPSNILGVALDGYPIYGSNDENGNQITPDDLDAFGGKIVNGEYRYYVTNVFPYTFLNFRGNIIDPNVLKNGCNTCDSVPISPCTEFDEQGGNWFNWGLDAGDEEETHEWVEYTLFECIPFKKPCT